MSQQQPWKPQADQSPQEEPIKYGDVLNVSGELASKPITPKDATMTQSAENQVLGQTQKSGLAAIMQYAATANLRAGLVGREDVSSKQGVSVSETKGGANSVITELVGQDVVGQLVEPNIPMNAPSSVLGRDAITIGEALEAMAISPAGDKPVELSDAAAIQAAEVRATGCNEVMSGGVGAEAQSAATRNNTRNLPFQDKTTLSDVLGDVREKLAGNKAVTREDAEGMIGAEIRNKVDMRTTPGGVAATMASAATLNQNK